MIVSPTHENIVVLSMFASSNRRCVTRAVPTPVICKRYPRSSTPGILEAMKVVIPPPRSSSLARLGAATLRLVFTQFAENNALAALKQTCRMSNCQLDDVVLRTIVRETIVPAYSHGWLDDVVTLKQLQTWVERRAGLSLADPLMDVIGLHQYLLLHCLSSALDAGKVSATDVLNRCPAAAYLYADLFNDIVLHAWRPEAANVRALIKVVEPEEGLRQWLAWTSQATTTDTIPLPTEL